MRRAVLVAAVSGVMVLGASTPAGAAPPERETVSGTFADLSSNSSECTAERNRTVCTDMFLSAWSDTTGSGTVCVTIETYSISRGRYTSISSESGCTDLPASALTVTDALTATLATTTVTLDSYECRRERCQVTGSRDVTVSAYDEPVGPVSTSSGRGTFTEGGCTYRYSYDTTSADVAGTITLDGTTYPEFGSASTGDYRTTSSCR